MLNQSYLDNISLLVRSDFKFISQMTCEQASGISASGQVCAGLTGNLTASIIKVVSPSEYSETVGKWFIGHDTINRSEMQYIK